MTIRYFHFEILLFLTLVFSSKVLCNVCDKDDEGATTNNFSLQQLNPQIMETAGIFKDVIDKFIPSVTLTVTYGGKEVKDGNEFKPSEVKDTPKVTWKADANDLYTLAMVDPDAPSRKDPKFGEWRHWLVVNIPGNDLAKGKVISQYMGSSPPKGTGLHRYIFLLFKQPNELKLSPMDDKGRGRANFKIREFAKTHKLTPVGGTFFQAQSE